MSIQQDKNKRRYIGQLIITPIIALTFFILAMIGIGPIIIDEFGEGGTKVIITVITVSLTVGYVIFIRKEYLMGHENPTFRKYSSISLSLLSFGMVPFGYAGMFVKQGEPHIVQKILGGSFCLAAGIYFMLVFLNCRKK
jgi:hypothetical protein